MPTVTKFLTNSNGKMLVDSTTGKPLSLTMDVVNGLSIRLAERAAVSTTYSTLASYSTTSQTYSNITNASEFAVGDVAILQWTITDRDNTAGIIFAEVSAVSSNSITAKGLGMSVKGDPGDDGAQIELQVANGQLQWKYDYQESWTNLIAMSELKGADGDDGKNIELQTTATYIQWRVVGDAEWKNLYPLSALKGADGQDGVTPLVYTKIATSYWNHQAGIFNCDLDGFNRQPVLGDTAFIVHAGNSGSTDDAVYVVFATITSVGLNNVQCTVIQSCNIRGAVGQDGLPALTYSKVRETTYVPPVNGIINFLEEGDLPPSYFNRTPVLDDVFILLQKNTTTGQTFITLCKITEAESDIEGTTQAVIETTGAEGTDGATFTPSVDTNGNLSWTNDGGLPNPETVNVRGAQGEAATVQVGTTTTLPAGSQATVNNSGTSNAAVLNFGIPKGEDGQGVPTGGTTGQVLKKKSGTDYDTEWGDESGGSGGGGGVEVVDLGDVQFSGTEGMVAVTSEQFAKMTAETPPIVKFSMDGATVELSRFQMAPDGAVFTFSGTVALDNTIMGFMLQGGSGSPAAVHIFMSQISIEQGGGVEVIDLGTAQLTEEYLGEGLYTGEISISQDNYNKLNADGYSVVKINITGGPLNNDSAPMWLSKRMQTDGIFLSGSVRADTIEFYAEVLTSKGAGTGYVSFYEKEVFSSGGGGSAEVTKEAIATALNLTTSQLDVLVSLAQKVTITGNDVKFATGTVLKSSYFDAVD